jgi:type IV fimbrial biogenesis protein FimT
MYILRKQAGVTLTELIITLSVIAILLSFSAPSYSEFINKRKIVGTANLIGTFFENVKMESVKRSEWITLTYKESSNGADWCFGAKMGRHKSCDCLADPAVTDCRLDPGETDNQAMIMSNTSYSGLDDLQTTTTVSSNYHMDFNPVRGTLSHSEKVTVQIKHSNADYLIDISVTPTGRVSKCTPTGHVLIGLPTCI